MRIKKFLQDAALLAYELVRQTGVLETKAGRHAFTAAYGVYKRLFDPGMGNLRAHVAPGSWVLDIGANIGVYTRQFAGWVSDGGKVVAIEPEPGNCALLREGLEKAGVVDRVRVVQAVAAETAGELRLRLNPANPADHRIAQDGIPVRAEVLDELLASEGFPRVSLIKIDVQGAETKVLRGCRRILSEWRPAIFMEVDDAALAEQGSSPEELERLLADAGYAMFRHDGSGPVSRNEAREARRGLGYADFLFLHRPRPDPSSGG